MGWYGWYICMALGFALMLCAVGVSFKKGLGTLRIGIVLGILFVATYVLYMPVFFGQYDATTAVFGGVVNVFQVISLDADYSECYNMVMSDVGIVTLAKIYMGLLGAVHLLLPTVSVLAAYNIFLRFYSSARIAFVNLRRRPLYVFSELNEKSLCLAGDIRAHQKKCDIVFADCVDNDPFHEKQKLRRFILHQDNVETIRILRRRQKDVYYFCICADEDKNLNTSLYLIEDMSGKSEETQMRTHIYLFSGQNDVDIMIDSTNKCSTDIRIVDPCESAAYKLLDDYPLYMSAGEKVISILLLGVSDINEAILRVSSWCGMLEGYTLKINLVGIHAGDRIAGLKFRYPELFDGKSDINAYDCDDYNDMFCTVREKCMDTTYAVVGFEDEGMTVESAIHLRRLLYKKDDTFSNAPPIFAYITNNEKYDMIAKLEASPGKKNTSYQIIPFGKDSSVYTCENLIDSSLEHLSRNVHLVYSDIYSDGDIDVKAELRKYNQFEFKKGSNRANAMHIRYKLALLGLDYTSDEDAEEVDFEKYLSAEKLELLTRAEHDRWEMFHKSQGWTTATIEEVEAYSKTGINGGRHDCQLLKKHPFICDFDELPERSAKLEREDSTKYDRDLIARIPDILHDKWGVSGHRYKIIEKRD